MLFIPPTDAELTSYNEIKYKNNIAISYSISTMDLKPLNKLTIDDNDLVVVNNSNFSNTDIKIGNSDFEISNLSTWEDYLNELDIENLVIKLSKHKTLMIKSKITKINHFTPQIVID